MELYNSITQKTYDPEQCVFFENALQSNAYVFRGNAELKAILEEQVPFSLDWIPETALVREFIGGSVYYQESK